MPNEIINDMDFEQRMVDMPDRKLLEFVARQTLEITVRCKVYDTKIASIEAGDRKVSGIMGGISGTITAIVISVINYFTTNRG